MTDIIKSFFFIIIGGIFHAGIIFISIPYIYYIFRDKTRGLSAKMKKAMIYLGIIIILVMVINLPSIFLKKLSFLLSPEALFNRINLSNIVQSDAGSKYLTSFRVDSFKDIILYAPLKVFYFLFSPMIWDVRGIADIITITLDSIFYIIFFLKVLLSLKELKSNNKRNLLIKNLNDKFYFCSRSICNGNNVLRYSDST